MYHNTQVLQQQHVRFLAQQSELPLSCAAPLGSPPEEDEVSLVVECDHPPAPELRVLMEEAAQHAADTAPKARVEVVQQQLRSVTTDAAVTLQRHQHSTHSQLQLLLLAALSWQP
jgi:hypothetical protein